MLVFGKRAGEYAATFAKGNPRGRIDQAQVDEAAKRSLEPFEPGRTENPYSIQHDLQETMQKLVGIVRIETEMQEALAELGRLKARAARAAVSGHREYNPGWHTAIDLGNLLTVSEAVTRCAIERKESRGGHFRDDYPEKSPEFGSINIVVRQTPDGSMEVRRVPIPPMPAELKQVIDENK